jgi:hypothetical protein
LRSPPAASAVLTRLAVEQKSRPIWGIPGARCLATVTGRRARRRWRRSQRAGGASNAQARRCSGAYDLLTRKSIAPTCSTATGSRFGWFARAQLGCAPQIIQRKRSKCFGDGRRGRLAGKLQASFGELLVVLRSTAYIFHQGSMSDLRFRQVVLMSPVFLDVSRSPNGGGAGLRFRRRLHAVQCPTASWPLDFSH